MSHTPTQLESAFILHQRLYRESSLLLEGFSESYGRIGLIAKGARRPRSSWYTLLRPFRPLQILWSGRGELKNLTHAEALAESPPLQGNTLLCGLYLNELLMRLTGRGEVNPDLFQLYHHSLDQLAGCDAAGIELEQQLRLFELRMLSLLGYGIQIDAAEQLQSEQLYRYDPELGEPLPLPDSAHGLLLSGRCLQALMAEPFQLDEACRRPIKQLLRHLLQRQLGDKPLRSRELFRFHQNSS